MASDLQTLRATMLATIDIINHITSKPGPKPGIANIVLEKEPILIASLQNGLNITQACLQAGISRVAFYDERGRNSDFSYRIEKAEQFASMKSRKNIMDAIMKGSVTDSWRFLERKDPEFKPKSEADLLSGGQPLKTALVEFVGDDGTTTKSTD